MPEDKRLYMTFPNDFWMHPKIAILTDAAFRAFVEMNGYSRVQDLDGRIPITAAKKMWKPKALTELQSNHPERPTLTVEGDEYVIRDYAKHQQTIAARAAAAEVSRVNGSKGGRPRKENPDITQGVSKNNPDVTQTKPRENQSQSQSPESENYLTDIGNPLKSSHLGDAPDSGHDIPESIIAKAKAAGITNLPAMVESLTSAVRQPVTPTAAIELALATTARARGHVRNVDKYVGTACRKSPADIIWDYERLDLGALT